MSDRRNYYDRYRDTRYSDHVHEVLGSVQIAEEREDPHNHRFATVSGKAIPKGEGNHIHEVKFCTDTFDDHNHEFCGKTCGAIRVGDRHVHFLESVTSIEDGHKHKFRVATLVDNPIEKECDDNRVRDIEYRDSCDCRNDRRDYRDFRRDYRDDRRDYREYNRY